MNVNNAIDFRNPSQIRKAGISALQKEFGAVGAVYFLRQFESGNDNYTQERDQLLAGISFDEIV